MSPVRLVSIEPYLICARGADRTVPSRFMSTGGLSAFETRQERGAARLTPAGLVLLPPGSQPAFPLRLPPTLVGMVRESGTRQRACLII